MAKSKERRLVRYSWETLELPCEWEDCSVVENAMHSFLLHVNVDHLSSLNGKDLHCHWKDCEGFTETLAELRRHILFHAFHTKIKCYGKNIQDRKNLPKCTLDCRSRNMIPELPDPFICYWENCLENFENPEYFYAHIEGHINCCSQSEGEKPGLKCYWTGCNRTFNDTYKLKEHARSHTQEKLIACPVCGGMFASRTKFFDHIHRQIPITGTNTKVYACQYCPRKMATERLLRDHMRFHVNHYKCPYCDMTCPTPSGMQVHISYRHSESKPHSCQYCDYRCKNQNDLRKHLETHSVVPTYTCPAEGCKYATRSNTCFKNHYRSKHEGEKSQLYACHLCNKTTTRGNYLTKHLTEHHKFRWPSGHCRFRYHLHEDGRYRLQTVRYESIELSEALLCDNEEKVDDPDETVDASYTSNIKTENSQSSFDPCGKLLSETPLSTKTDLLKVENSVENSTLISIPLYVYVNNDTNNSSGSVDPKINNSVL